MDDGKTLLSAQDADRLLAAKDGGAALLYLHIVRTGAFSLTAAARDLQRSESDIALAAETLRRLGLLSVGDAPLPERGVPEYTAEDIVRRAASDCAFSGVVDEAESALGRVLNSSDLKLLFGIYDYWGLPADVIFLLLHHCVETYQQKNGAGRLPTMRYVEKEAQHWAKQEVTTLDAAEEHMRRERARQEQTEQVKEALQIRGRALTASEAKYVESWLEMGFGPDTVAVAYDRTVVSTGKLVWKYMDTILRKWDEMKLYTPEAVEAGDARRSGRKPAGNGAEPPHSEDEKLAAMRKMYEHLKSREG